MAHSGKTMTFATDLVPQEDNIYSLGTDDLKWIIRGSLPLSDITGADDLKAIEAISGTTGLLKKTAANTWTLDTNTYSPTSHNHNSTYLKLDGSNNMTADVNIIAGDTDKFVNFWYNTSKTAGASWRTGMLGSGSGNTNYFVIQSGTSTTSATTWHNALKIGQNNYDIYNNENRIPNTGNATGSVGGTTTPVYVDGGVIKAGTALGTASQKAESYFVKAVTSTDNAIVRFDGTNGQVQKSGIIIDDNDHLIAPAIRIANTYYGISFGRTTGTPVETILHTGIKWVGSSHMPVIHITGYAYGLQSPVEFKIGFYIYGDKIGWSGATNMGSWEPDIYLYKDIRDDTNYVAIGLAGRCYFLQLSVDIQDEMGKFNKISTDSSNWSWEFLTTTGNIPQTDDGTSCCSVPYKASIFSAKNAQITTTTNAIAYYTNTTGTFGSKASANGALYATSANGALQWGTLPIAQGGTGQTTLTAARQQFSGPEFIVGTWTAASGTWTGTTTDSELYDGKQIILYMPFAGSGNATLNLTLADGTTTGAKNVYFEGKNRFTTHKGQNAQLHLIYHSDLKLSDGITYEGWWYVANRDTDNDYHTRQKVLANTDTSNRSLLLANPIVGTADNNTSYVTYRNDKIYANVNTGIITATGFNGNLTGDVTGNADTATDATNATNATYALYMKSQDTRDAVIDPKDMNANTIGVRFDFKKTNKVNLTLNAYEFTGVMTYRPYSSGEDFSGGPVHQIAFNAENLSWRTSTSATTWNDWKQLTLGGSWTSEKMYLLGTTTDNVGTVDGSTTHTNTSVFVQDAMLSAKSLGINAYTNLNKITLQWNDTDNSLDFIFT